MKKPIALFIKQVIAAVLSLAAVITQATLPVFAETSLLTAVSPRTGDTGPGWIYIVAAASAVIVIVLLILGKKKK